MCAPLCAAVVELDALKMNINAPLTWGLRHRRESLSGMSLHSQPIGHLNSGYPGTQSPAPTYHSTGLYFFERFLSVF